MIRGSFKKNLEIVGDYNKLNGRSIRLETVRDVTSCLRVGLATNTSVGHLNNFKSRLEMEEEKTVV